MDVTTWSPRTRLTIAVVSLVLAAALVASLAFTSRETKLGQGSNPSTSSEASRRSNSGDASRRDQHVTVGDTRSEGLARKLVRFDVGRDDIPEHWHGIFTSRALPVDARPEGLIRVTRALEKYPEGFIASVLRRIYLLSALRVHNVPGGGTATDDSVYVVDSSRQDFVEGTFHAELSSVLLYRYGDLFDHVAWKKLNPPGFRYRDRRTGGVASAAAGADSTLASARPHEGFLSEYALSTLTNDVNAYAMHLFLPQQEFATLVNNHWRVRQKRQQLIGFYCAIDSRLDQGYFDGLADSVRVGGE